MEWIKVKAKHILFSELSLSEIGALMKIRALTAELEKMPTKRQILDLPGMGQKIVKRLTESLRNTDGTLTKIQELDLEDVGLVEKKREDSRKRKQRSRSKDEDVTRDKDVTSQGRHEDVTGPSRYREEKSRVREEDKDKGIDTKKQQQANPKEAAAFLKNEDQEKTNPEIIEIIKKVIAIRVSAGAKIPNPGGYENKLLKSYEKDNESLLHWQIEIQRHDAERKTEKGKNQTQIEEQNLAQEWFEAWNKNDEAEKKKRRDEQAHNARDDLQEKADAVRDLFRELPGEEADAVMSEARRMTKKLNPGKSIGHYSEGSNAVMLNVGKIIESRSAVGMVG